MTMKTNKTLQHIAAVAVVLLTLCMVFTAPAMAWNPEVEDYAIYDVANLTAFRDYVESNSMSGITVTLENNIDLEYGEWSPIGTSSGKFSGIFDGKEYTISNFTISSPNQKDIGLFGVVSPSATIKNVTVKNAIITGGDRVGGIVGYCYGSVFNCHVQNVTLTAVPYGDGAYDGGAKVGGIVGLLNEGSYRLTECSASNVKITAFRDAGGIAGMAQYGTFVTKNQVNDITITIDKKTNFYLDGGKGTQINAGAIVGRLGVKDDLKVTLSDNTESNVIIEVDAVAKIGDAYYGSLADAVAAAYANNDGTSATTVTLLKDAQGPGIKVVNDRDGIVENIIIDFGGNTYTVGTPVGSSNTVSQAFHLEKETAFTLKNGVIEACEETSNIKMLLQNYCNLTLDGMILDGTNLAGNVPYTLSINSGKVDIKGTTSIITKENGVAFDVCWGPLRGYPEGTQVTIDTTGTISGNVEYGYWKGVSESTLEDPTYSANPSTLTIKNGNFENFAVTFAPFDETSKDNLTKVAVKNIKIYGGTFSADPSAYVAAKYAAVPYEGKYLIQKMVEVTYGGSSTTEPEEPEQPEQPEEPVEPTPETPAAPGEVASSTEVTDGGDVTFETPAGEDGTAPAAADDEVKGVVLPTGTEGTVEFVPVSEQPAPAGQEENTKRVFEINVPSYKKGEASVIKFQMTVAEIEADGKTAADVALWHYDEETGEWTKLVTSFIIKDGIVYFEAITNDFSPFAIVYADEPAADLPTDTPETPEQPEEPASPAPVLAVLAALGAAVVLRRK